MLEQVVWAFLFIVAALAVYRWRHEIIGGLKRFDADNVRRIAEQERDKADPIAHYRHTLHTAEEQVEEVSEVVDSDARLGTPITRYLFEGERFATRTEAERARAEKIRAIARGYYMDLPVALSERRKDKLH
jgi:hypothetical protein